MWKVIYCIVLVFSILATFILWQEEYLGLNVYGMCDSSFVRKQDSSIAFPITLIVQNVLFIGIGIFTIRYFKKHYPDSIGLRTKRRYQKQVLILFVVGYSFFWAL